MDEELWKREMEKRAEAREILLEAMKQLSEAMKEDTPMEAKWERVQILAHGAHALAELAKEIRE